MKRFVSELETYHARKTVGLWHCGEYEVIACKEFYKPDECQPGEVHLKCCSDCFPVIKAERERERHVTGLSVGLL